MFLHIYTQEKISFLIRPTVHHKFLLLLRRFINKGAEVTLNRTMYRVDRQYRFTVELNSKLSLVLPVVWSAVIIAKDATNGFVKETSSKVVLKGKINFTSECKFFQRVTDAGTSFVKRQASFCYEVFFF